MRHSRHPAPCGRLRSRRRDPPADRPDRPPRARRRRPAPGRRGRTGPPAPEHRRPVDGRAPADGQRRWRRLDRVQRRDLQPRRTTPPTRRPGSRLPLRHRYRGDPGRLPAVARGLRGPLRGHVGVRDLGAGAAPAVLLARPPGHQALLLRLGQWQLRVRLGDQGGARQRRGAGARRPRGPAPAAGLSRPHRQRRDLLRGHRAIAAGAQCRAGGRPTVAAPLLAGRRPSRRRRLARPRPRDPLPGRTRAGGRIAPAQRRAGRRLPERRPGFRRAGPAGVTANGHAPAHVLGDLPGHAIRRVALDPCPHRPGAQPGAERVEPGRQRPGRCPGARHLALRGAAVGPQRVFLVAGDEGGQRRRHQGGVERPGRRRSCWPVIRATTPPT